MSTIDTTCVNAIRVLSADAIQKANSGHPGLPLGAAPIAYELWANHMNHNAKDPKWANRDRYEISMSRLLLLAWLAPIMMSGLIEILQATCTGGRRSGEWLDFAANSIGVTLATVGWTAWLKIKRVFF